MVGSLLTLRPCLRSRSSGSASASSECLCCRLSSLFDCTSMVVLMSRESSPASEGFLAVSIGTFIRSFAGVDASVARK